MQCGTRTQSLQGVLERCSGFLCGFGDLLSHGPRRPDGMSPTTIPRTPPSGFCNALILPNLRTSFAWGGTSPRAIMLANSVNACRSPSFSNMGNRCSPVIPEGPATAPRLALRTFLANLSSSNWTSGIRFNNSGGVTSRGRDGRRSGLVNALRVFKLPGVNSVLSSACHAALNSPTMANFSAGAAL